MNAPEKLDFKRILPIIVIVLVDLLGLTIIIPLLPLYATAFGANAVVIGILNAAYPMMQLVGAPILGSLSDRFGRKPVLLVSQMGTFVGFILLGFANGLPILFLSRIIDGLSGGNISTAQAALSDSTSEKNRTQAMGLIGAAFGLGFTIGPIIAFVSLSLSGYNYAMPAFVAAGFSLISILLTAFWFKETLDPSKRNTSNTTYSISPNAMLKAIAQPKVGFLLALVFAAQAIFGGFENLLALFTLNRLGMGAGGNSGLFAFIGVLAVVVQGGLVRQWSKKYGDKWIILLGLSTLGIGLLLAALTPMIPLPNYSQAAIQAELAGSTGAKSSVALPPDNTNGILGIAWLMIAMIPATIGGSVLGPTLSSSISKNVAPTETGKYLGLNSAFNSLANVIAPIVGGLIFQYLGASWPFIVGAIVMLGLWVLARQRVPASKVA